MKTTKRKLNWLKFGSVVGLVAPMLIVLGVNFDNYFTVEQGFFVDQWIEVSVGGVLGLGTVVLMALKKANFLKGSWGLIIGFVLSILLKSIINDIILIMFALASGSIINTAFKAPIENMHKTYEYEKQAGIQAKAVGNVLKEINKEPEVAIRSGRV